MPNTLQYLVKLTFSFYIKLNPCNSGIERHPEGGSVLHGSKDNCAGLDLYHIPICYWLLDFQKGIIYFLLNISNTELEPLLSG